MTKYYYLKLGTGNCLAEYWLNPKGKRSIYEGYEHAAAIYFGRNTAKDIRECAELYEEEGASKEEALRKFKEKLNSDKDKTSKPDLEAAIHFVRAGEKSEKTCFVTILAVQQINLTSRPSI
ncbi:MAG: hypothetical protein IBX41_09475 [Methanophagales archaeon]|nr:hypothetical protein [Methanophagales archaeon]